MKFRILFLLFFTYSSVLVSQNLTFSDRSSFLVGTSSNQHEVESFNNYTSGQVVSSLFGGKVLFSGQSPTIFAGGWFQSCGAHEVVGNSLIPEPRFQGNSLEMLFNTPINGIGAGIYDDVDGTPAVNIISLTAITTQGDTIYIQENCNQNGDLGFLGASSGDSIIKAIWQIDNTDGNLELDSIIIAYGENNLYYDRGGLSSRCNGENASLFNETFSSFTTGQAINSLMNGMITFSGQAPTTFAGGWQNNGCGADEFSGNALIPEPRFQGNSLEMNFSTIVHGVGASVYDDVDGTPAVNKIDFKVITTLGDTVSMSESCNQYEEAGFLGIYSSTPITKAIWSIDNNNGNLEIDSLIVCYKNDQTNINQDFLNESFKLKVYPNPSNGNFNFQGTESILSIEVFNIDGKLVFQDMNIRSNEYFLNGDLLDRGSYLVRVLLNTGKYNRGICKRIIKQ